MTGVKKLTRLPSGSRSNNERLPHGMVVGYWTQSRTTGMSRVYSLPTSSTLNSSGAMTNAPKRCETHRHTEYAADTDG